VLQPPDGPASSAAVVAELAKLSIHVDGTTSPGHDAVTIDFTATDTTGLSDSTRSTLSFAAGGSAPPAPPEVHVDAGPLATPSPTIEPLLTPTHA